MACNEPGPGRDPWNQGPKRGDNKKPPQLDDILKRLKERFGGKGGGGGSSGGGLPKNLPAGLLGLGAIVIVGLWRASGAYVVDEPERAVGLRFGQHIDKTGSESCGEIWCK